ncbi:MAG: hypothetical protein ACRD0W_14720 [Acidimicrobiales bacterium]
MTIGDYLASRLRTAVPYLWGLAVTWLLQRWTGAPEQVAEWLGGPGAIAAVSAVAALAWYELWRHLEPHIPDWLTRAVLGSAQQPTYNAVLKAVRSPNGVYYVAGPASSQPTGSLVTRRDTVAELTQER